MTYHNLMTMERPLSPHLQVYRLPLTAVLSILHRMTGVVLSLGIVLLVIMCVALAVSESAYTAMMGLFGGWFGCAVLIAWTGALYLHLCNGVRHLIWDAGWGFELRTVDASAVTAIVATVVLTALTWTIVWMMQ